MTFPSSLSSSATQANHGLHGIMNIGSTCYLAAVLQCIGHCPFLVTSLVKVDSTSNSTSKTESSQLTDAVRTFFVNKWRRRDAPIILNPRCLVDALLKSRTSNFQYLVQNDAQEFLIHLLTALEHEDNIKHRQSQRHDNACDIKASTNNDRTISWLMKRHFKNSTTSSCPLTRCLYGQHTSILKCLNTSCSFIQPSFDVFLTLGIALDDSSRSPCESTKVSALLARQSANIEVLQDYKCDKCGHHGVMRECHLSVGPDVLVIHLLRFPDRERKSMYPIELEETLFVPCATTMDIKVVYEYRLCGIVCHSGCILSGGHYYAICRHVDWVIFDDESVGKVNSIGSIPGADPYMLFYAKVDRASSSSS